MNYYNEFDPRTAAWLRELIKQGHIPNGDVDTRSIAEVAPGDLRGYTQCHFFAGIGGWSLALRLAGWPDARPVWTGSCPCQPFSSAGKQLGTKDARHLFPTFRRLIARSGPAVVFGEQVASAAGRLWLARVRREMEALGYALGSADLCAAGVGAPHIRQRLFWVAHSTSARRIGAIAGAESEARDEARLLVPSAGSAARAVADTDGGHASAERLQRSGKHGQREEDGGALRMGDADDSGREGRGERGDRRSEWTPWASSVVLSCTDGKARRIEPSAFPLVDGLPGRVGLLRGYGNAIVPQVAAEFIAAYLETSH